MGATLYDYYVTPLYSIKWRCAVNVELIISCIAMISDLKIVWIRFYRKEVLKDFIEIESNSGRYKLVIKAILTLGAPCLIVLAESTLAKHFESSWSQG